MWKWITAFWISSEPVDFVSRFGLDEAVERLRTATRRSSFFGPMTEAAVGTVKASRVQLRRSVPMMRNSFKPAFVGKFEVVSGKTVLKGRFGQPFLVKVFLVFWLGMVTLISLMTTSATAHPVPKPVMFMPVGMIVFALLLTAFGTWLSRNDQAWLTQVIGDALDSWNADSADYGHTTALSRPVLAKTVSQLPLFAAAAMALFGVMSWAGAALDIQQAQWTPTSSVVMHFQSPMLRFAMAAWGSVLLAVALGLFYRKRLAWLAAFVAIGGGSAVSLCNGFMQMRGMDKGPPWFVILFMGLVFFFVAFCWGRWWYAQREHFDK